MTEPTDVGPAAGGDKPVTAADRYACQTLLDSALHDERITPSEHSERSAAVANARVFDDLVPLTRDLTTSPSWSVMPTPQSALATSTPRTPAVIPGHADSEAELFVGIFGGTNRPIHSLRRRSVAISIMGGHELDLTNATFEDQVCTIDVTSLMGGVELTVPDGVDVVNQTISIFGGVEIKGLTPVPGGPKIVLRGFQMFGGVDVRGPESREVQRRRRREARREGRA